MYEACDPDGDMNGIRLPDGFFFDYDRQFSKWDSELLDEFRIQAGRCGCNSGVAALRSSLLLTLAFASALTVLLASILMV